MISLPPRRVAAPGATVTAGGLRSLRLRLTLLYAIVSALALGTLGAFLLIADERLRSNSLDADLRLQATQGVRSVWFDNETFHSESFVGDDSLVAGFPQLYVVLRDGEAKDGGIEVHREVSPKTPYYEGAPVDEIARDAMAGDGEAIRRARLGGTYPVRLLAAPIGGPNGLPGGAVVAIADEQSLVATTKRLRLYVSGGGLGLLLLSSLAGFVLAGRSIRPATNALTQQERFLADAAHEIRTPIAAIRALSEGALAGDQPPAEALARTGDIAAEASQTVDDLLFLARADAGRIDVRKERLRLDLLVDAALDDVAGVDLVAEPTVVEGDPALLRRAVGNLVANAVRHGRALDPGAQIEVTVTPGAVRVADRGPGIEPGIANLAFERFQSGRRSGGTGLGLPLARLIARAHDGDVTLAPREGGGAVATLTVPVAETSGTPGTGAPV